MSKRQDRNDTVTLFFSRLPPHSCLVGSVLLLEEISSFIYSLVFNQKPSTHLNPRNTRSPVLIMSSVVYSSKLPTSFKTEVLPLPQLQPASVGRAAPQLGVISHPSLLSSPETPLPTSQLPLGLFHY